MLEALLMFLIYGLVVCVVAGLILWAIQTYGPAEFYPPARMIVGLVVLVVMLVLLLHLVRGMPSPL